MDLLVLTVQRTAVALLVGCYHCSFYIGSRSAAPLLPADPLLALRRPPLPPLSQSAAPQPPRVMSPSVVVTEGIPPVSSQVIGRIRRWEFIDLSLLLEGADTGETSTSMDGCMAPSTPPAKTPRKSPSPIRDLTSWLQAYSRFMTVLLSAPATTKEEAAGLVAHQHLVIQLAQDLGGRQWLVYDQEFREWAAAKFIKVWGELNLSIYGRCLSHPSTSSVDEASSTPVCFKWNQGHCQRPRCKYLHQCSECGGSHRRSQCHFQRRRNRVLGKELDFNVIIYQAINYHSAAHQTVTLITLLYLYVSCTTYILTGTGLLQAASNPCILMYTMSFLSVTILLDIVLLREVKPH